MRTIHNETVTFRCPNTLKERLEAYGEQNDLHLSQVIRRACADFVKQDRPAIALANKKAGIERSRKAL